MPGASSPLATWVAVVERGTLPLQVPPVPPVTVVHFAVTALAGRLAQVLKEAGALTVSFQVFAGPPPFVSQLSVTGPEPLTEGVVSGSGAVKVIVAGLAANAFEMLVAIGFATTVAGRSVAAPAPVPAQVPAEVPAEGAAPAIRIAVNSGNTNIGYLSS